MAGCRWGEDISRADGQAPGVSGHPAAKKPVKKSDKLFVAALYERRSH